MLIRPLHFRFLGTLALLLFLSTFAYWYNGVRPYLCIKGAHVESFSTVISSDIAARIVELGPQEGDFVKKGDVLFTLERDFLLAKQAQMKGVLDSFVEQIEKEKGRLGKAMEDYLTATNGLELGAESSDESKKQLTLMEEAQEKSQQAHSQLTSVKTEMGLLDLQLKKMIFTAPFNGVVLKRLKTEGSVALFGDPIYTLSDPNRVWIDAEIPEEESSHVIVGTQARITLAAFPKKEFMGKVTYIGPATVVKREPILPFQKAKIPIKISIENSCVSLKPGLSATVRLKLGFATF